LFNSGGSNELEVTRTTRYSQFQLDSPIFVKRHSAYSFDIPITIKNHFNESVDIPIYGKRHFSFSTDMEVDDTAHWSSLPFAGAIANIAIRIFAMRRLKLA